MCGNNPLEALRNILYLVCSKSTPPEDAAGYLNDAQHELLRISAITKQTLAWSRLEGNLVETSAHTLFEETLKLFTGKIKNKGIRLNLDLDPTAVVRVVPGEISQVLANLLSNAIDAVTLNGVIDVVLETDGGSRVEISVVDNGKGINPAEMENLFRPFQTTKGNLGNGLGLYVSKNIIDRHNGELRIESQPMVGTRVTVILPGVEDAETNDRVEEMIWMSRG